MSIIWKIHIKVDKCILLWSFVWDFPQTSHILILLPFPRKPRGWIFREIGEQTCNFYWRRFGSSPGLIYASLPCAEEISARISSKMVPPVPSRSCLMLMHPSWRRHGLRSTLSCPSLVYVGPACPCCLVPVTCHQSPSNFTPPVTSHVQEHG